MDIGQIVEIPGKIFRVVTVIVLRFDKHTLYNRKRSKEENAARMRAFRERQRVRGFDHSKEYKHKAAREKEARAHRPFVCLDSEGFDTGRYFTNESKNTAQKWRELDRQAKEYNAIFMDQSRSREEREEAWSRRHEVERLKDDLEDDPILGWDIIDRDRYLANHKCSEKHAKPCAMNKTYPYDIYREHKPFLFMAGSCDESGKPKTANLCNSVEGASKTPLHMEEIFEWLTKLPREFGDVIFISFAFGYDVAQILAELPFQDKMELRKGEEDGSEGMPKSNVHFWFSKTTGNGYAISYRRGKEFTIGLLRNPYKPYKLKAINDKDRRAAAIGAGHEPVERAIDYAPRSFIRINDVFGFFQSSFVRAVQGMHIGQTPDFLRGLTDREMLALVDGKAHRAEMDSLPLSEVFRYTSIELKAACLMMDKLRANFEELGLKIKRWQGGGSVARAMYNKHRSLEAFPYVATKNPVIYQVWAHHAFFGGRIEQVKQGRYTGVIHCYDIASAYPAIQEGLPAMRIPIEWASQGTRLKPIKWREGKWKEHSFIKESWAERRSSLRAMSAYTMVGLKFNFPKEAADGRSVPFYPLPYRTMSGAILFPSKGLGRYMVEEVSAAIEWLDVMRPDWSYKRKLKALDVSLVLEFIPPLMAEKETDDTHEWLSAVGVPHEPGKPVKLFAFERVYFDKRCAIKAEDEHDIRQQCLKLGINSSYGKLAQSVGGHDGRAPSTSFPWAAAAITAGTRAALLRAALKSPWSIIFFATDGLQSTEPLKIEASDKQLGQWEYSRAAQGVYVMPGVYAFAVPTSDGVKFTGKSRGVSVFSILGEGASTDMDWFEWLDATAADYWNRGEELFTHSCQRLMTFGASSVSSDLSDMCGMWVETERTLSMNSGGTKRVKCSDPNRVNGLVLLGIAENETPDVMCARHTPGWLDVDFQKEKAQRTETLEIIMGRFM